MVSAAAARAEEVLPGVFQIACPFGAGGTVYVYYLEAPQPAIVDTGVRQSPPEVIAPALAAVGKSIEGVRYILNTHGHWDHTGGNAATRRLAPRVEICIHRDDVYLLQSAEAHVQGYSAYGPRLMNDTAGLEMVDRTQRAGIEVPTPADVLVEDGQVLDLGHGIEVRVVHTPGHSRGSVSYLVGSALFTGDGIQGLGSRPGQLPLVFDDSRAYRSSIARIAELGIDALCMGHAFCGLSAESGRDPVRRGSAARTFLEESGEAVKVVEEAMRSVLQDSPAAPFPDAARRVLARIARPLGVELDETGLSGRSIVTLHAFYRELTGAATP